MILSFGACGFNCSSWCGEFYPEDLPPEWCCDYYANEFDSVYLNHEQQDEIKSAMESLDSRFYLLVEDSQEVRQLLDTFEKEELPHVGYCICNDSRVSQVGQFFLLHTGKVASSDSLLDETSYVLAYHDVAVTNRDLKMLIDHLYKQFESESCVFVFFAGAAVTASQIKLAQTINDLMSTSAG